MTLRIVLPWPVAKLSPNARVHPIQLRTLQSKARQDAAWCTQDAIAKAGIDLHAIPHDGESDILLKQTAYPPDRRQRDRDNLDAALKSARDGIADRLKVNDRFFRPTGIEWGPVKKGGEIHIEIEVSA